MKSSILCMKTRIILTAIILAATLLPVEAKTDVDIAKMPHPRLIVSDKEFKQMVRSINSGQNVLLVRMHEKAMARANRCVRTGKMPEYDPNATSQLKRSRDALMQIFNCAYAFRYSRDYKYLIHAENVLKNVCELADWSPEHFLDVSEMMQAVSIGYDWLYKDLDKAVKKMVEDRIQRYGFDVSEDNRYNIRTFRANYNWSEVLNAGYAAAALAIYEVNPERCQGILERSIKNYQEVCSNFYGPDGVYAEGPNYWGYGTSNHILMSSLLQGVFGEDFGITDIPGFDKTAEFITFMSGSTGKFNFSDSFPALSYNHWLWFFAAKYNNPSLVYECKRLEHLVSDHRLGPLAIYWASKVDPAEIKAPAELLYTGHGKIELAVARTGWDKDDAYLAIKGGKTRVTHGHMDCGSFIYENEGVRWAREMPIPKYDVNNKGLKTMGGPSWHVHSDTRWHLLAYRAIDHNTIVVNGHNHQIDSVAHLISSFDNGDQGRGATLDLTPIYGGELSKASRTVSIMKDKSLQVLDSLAANDTLDANVRWNFITSAQPQLTDGGILLENGGKRMILKASGADLKYEIWSVDPKDYPDDPYMAWQPKPKDTYACGFTFTIPKRENRNLKITLTKTE